MDNKIPKGYKNTEIGVIPVDWEVTKLGICLTEKPKYGIGAAAIDYNVNFPTYLRITDIEEDGSLRKNDLKSVNHHESSNYYLKEGDVVFARTGASVGKTYLHKSKNGEFVYAGFLIKITTNSEILNSGFLKSFTETKPYWNWVRVNSMRSGQPGINGNEYANMQIPLPPLPEQKAIATVLSDTDKLIQTLEKKIAKKQLIKKGAMQDLLSPINSATGKLKEGWVEKTLGEVVLKFQNGYGFSASGYVDNGTPIVTMAQIGLDGSFQYNYIKTNKWKLSDFKLLKNYHLKNGDLIIAMTDVTPEKNLIGRMTIVKAEQTLLLNQRVGLLRIDESKVNAYFLKTYSNMKKWRDYSIASASLGVQANIGTYDILNGKIDLPPIQEQTQIAQILSDMDSELELLEKKLAKYKTLKQGLMQVLLTGQKRLV